MKNITSLVFLLSLMISGCSQEEIPANEASVSDGRIFTTEFEQNESRTYVEDGRYIRWAADDRISLFDGSTLNRQYKFDGKTGDSGGTFSMVDKEFGTGNLLTANYAVYPYSAGMTIKEDGVITTFLPTIRHYAVNSFGLGDNVMVARTHNVYDTSLKFKNLGGCFKLQLYGDDVRVKSITLMGNNNEKVSGRAYITAAYDKAPVVSIEDNAFAKYVTLDCGEEGVKLGASEEDATAFWITLPPVTFEKGITVMVTDANNQVFIQSTQKELVIERNIVKPMAPVEVKQDIPYLTFMASGLQKFSMSKAVETLEYSVDGGSWYELGTNTVEFGGELGVLRLRGKNLMGTAKDRYDYSTIEFSTSEAVACGGDIRTLLDYSNYSSVKTDDARFCRLFDYCSRLIQAPALPATDLADYCYYKMFNYCSSLTQAPDLPATDLADYCYYNMFNYCYNLTKAPDLPATTLADYCYSYMFYVCTGLNSITMLATDISANNCLNNWLTVVSSSGTFIKAKEMTSLPEGSSGIPSGWTVKNYGE